MVRRMEYTKLNRAGKVVKYSFIIFTLLFLVVGLAIFAAGIYLAVTGERYAVLTGSSIVAGAAILIVCGIITIAISVVGLVAAIGQFRWILLIFAATVAVVIILELAAGIYGFVRRNELVSESSMVRTQFFNALDRYLPESNVNYQSSINVAVDFVQDGLDCCGVLDRSDWTNTTYYSLTDQYPDSCCAAEMNCGPLTSHNLDCINATQAFISENAYAIGGIGLVFAVVEVLGILLALLLCCCIHTRKKKAASSSAGKEGKAMMEKDSEKVKM